MSSWDTNLWRNFCDPHWELICHNKWHPGTSETSTLPETAVGTHFNAQHGYKTTPVFLPAEGEASRLLLPSLVSLLSGSTIHPENNYSCILNVIGQVWESQKRVSINTNHRYYQVLGYLLIYLLTNLLIYFLTYLLSCP